MNAKEKIQAIVKEKADHEQTLEGLQAALDAAADVGDLAEVKRVQTEMAAVQELVASCDRRAKALQADLTAEQKATQREANDAALAKVKDSFKRLLPHARKIGQLVATLAAELETFHAIAQEAAEGDLFMQTARTIYAAKAVEDGDYSGDLNTKRWKAAISLATGGIQSHNGSKIVMPYGMSYDVFRNTLQAQAEQIVKAGGALNTTPREMLRLPLENIGDGRYLFRRGAGYLVNKDGRPVVVDLNGGR